MATHHQSEPSLQRLESIALHHVSNFDGVNLLTQLSIGESFPTTSPNRIFICKTNTNLNGNLLFPLSENYTTATKYSRKMSWHGLLKHLKSQQIVYNIEIFKNLKKRNEKYDLHTQEFPLELKQMKKKNFPCQNNIKVYSNVSTPIDLERKELEVKRLEFPLKADKEFILQDNFKYIIDSNCEKNFQFPQKFTENKEHIQFETKSHSNTNLNIQNFKQMKTIFKPLRHVTSYNDECDEDFSTKFPCQMPAISLKFPKKNENIKTKQVHYSANNWVKVNNYNKSIYLPLLSITHSEQNIEDEHVSQVQDAQDRVEKKISPTFANTENQKPPPQQATTKNIYDNDHDDINILADINSINNTRPNDVGYFAGKIECLQEAIIALFEKIQNSLTTNHNSEYENTNAAKPDDDDGDGNIRFALTPPMSVTSVRNNKRNDYEKYDLNDLSDCKVGQIVECSDVHDTLAETVDNGVTITKVQTKCTDSVLVKSEKELTSPLSLNLNSSNESIEYTSLVNCTNVSELLPKYDVLAIIEDLKNDINQTIDITARETVKAVINTCECDLTNVNEALLTENEQENTKNEKNLLQFSEAFKLENNNFYNDLQDYEMKFEMNKVKSALPNSISERSLGKRDNIDYDRHTGINTSRLSNDVAPSINRLPHSLSSIRNYNDSLYTPRSSMKTESTTLASLVPPRSTLTHDKISNPTVASTPSSLSETILRRTNQNSLNATNDSTSRPSLGALRNIQSTSLLSVDLPRNTTLTNKIEPINQTGSVNRAVSIDSSLEHVLPERTRLRRQRRLRTQNSEDEPEDAIERLNRLKARISASLSEVKGVLKQYSTDAENDNESQTAASSNSVREAEQDESKEGPITFRFIKKVRRRSLFDEDDEKGQEEIKTTEELSNENTKNHLDKQPENKNELVNCQFQTGTTLPTKNTESIEGFNEKPLDKITEEEHVAKPFPMETNEIKLNTNLYTLKEDAQESSDDVLQTESKPQREIMEHKSIKYETKGAIPKTITNQETNQTEKDYLRETKKRANKKIVIKSKGPSRRASLAAVEGSKIEPPINVAIPAKIERRPSDSGAVIKKKLITAKTNTSGIVEEVTPKLKIVKVKKTAIKNNNGSQLATTQTKLQNEQKFTTAENNKSDNHAKLIDDKDNKSIHTDKNKDVLMPKQPQPQQQQQINNEITRQTNLLQPTQSVIDEAASFEETIENSVLPPRSQQKQEQEEEDQQATTATNFKSNDLLTKGAMLENITNLLGSTTSSGANHDIGRENSVQQEDLHDFLQQETTIVKPSQANKSKVKDILTSPASTEELHENTKRIQTTTKEQQEKLHTQHQQVIATTDVVHVESDDDNNKHEDIKAEESLKEPCTDKTTTSTHDRAEQQHHRLPIEDEQSITNVDDTKTISAPHISISCTSDLTDKTTTASLLSSESAVEEKAVVPVGQQNTMPEQQLAPAPVQTADIISHPEHHKKKIIIKKIVRQTSADKTKITELEKLKATEAAKQDAAEQPTNETKQTQEAEAEPVAIESGEEILDEECSESTEISESSNSIGSEDLSAEQIPKKERKVKKKVIIKRQKRRLSIGDSFFRVGSEEDAQNAEIETLEKPIAYVSDDESDTSEKKEDEVKSPDEEKEKKPLKSCILHKEYNIGDEVLYAERFKKTQIKWRRGRIKERITSISYLLDIDGKEVSSHINYLKKFTGRKVSFGGKEYLEIDYEQLAEEEEKAERLKKRTYSIWNMV